MPLHRHFETPDHAKMYSKYRPTYPKELYGMLLNYLDEGTPAPHRQAIDIGCGSGHNTRVLAQHFEHVLGTDISEAQIEETKYSENKGNIEYRVGGFDDMFLPSGSVDLVTAAASAHYFDPVEDFYAEADRVLRPHGVVTMFCYDDPQIIDCENSDCTKKLNDEILKYYRDPEMLKFVIPRYKIVTDHYSGFKLPYPGWKRVELPFTQSTKLAGVVGYMKTLHFYQRYLKTNPSGPDPVNNMAKTFQNIIGPDKSLEEFTCTIEYPLFMVIGRKPASS